MLGSLPKKSQRIKMGFYKQTLISISHVKAWVGVWMTKAKINGMEGEGGNI